MLFEFKVAWSLSHLLWQLGLYLFLQSAQQEGAEHFMQTPDYQDGLLLVQVDLGESESVCDDKPKTVYPLHSD